MKKDKELKIYVAGLTNTGKSRVTYLIKEFLRGHGLDVEFAESIDHPDEVLFDRDMEKNLDDVIESLKERVHITIQEVQTQKPPTLNEVNKALTKEQ